MNFNDLLNFNKFVAPSLIRIVYWIGIVFIILGTLGGVVGGGMMGGMGGGMALNQLLIQMDGVDEPKFWAKFWTNRVNNLLDASYLVPRRIAGRSLRL